MVARAHRPRARLDRLYGVGTISTVKTITEKLTTLFPEGAALHEPEFSGNEIGYLRECIETGWVSSVGPHVTRFEDMLVEVTGANHAIATVNGTAALQICLLLAGVEAGDEVIVPALTFVATANAVSYLGAHPHFADAEERTLGLDPAKLDAHLAGIGEPIPGGVKNRQTGRIIRAVVCMHTFGHPVDMDPLVAVCDRHGLTLIEDAAESLGSTYKGRHTGGDGLLSALSFNGNKIVTTGGGGAILTNDQDLAKKAKHLTTTAKEPHRWNFGHDQIGYNFRLANVNAALGCAQLEQLPGFLKRKRILAEKYRLAFDGMEGVRFFTEPKNCKSNYWLNVLLLDAGIPAVRDAVLEATNKAGIMTRPAWIPMHKLVMYKDCPHMDLSVAENLFDRIINIPSSAALEKAAA